MDNFNEKNNKSNELLNREVLCNRFDLTLSFSKRYQMSTAIGYLRINFPKDLAEDEESLAETILVNTISLRLKRCIRDIDTVLRLNRTDFILFIVDVTEDDCSMVCNRIIDSISDTYTINSNQFTISISIGICMFPYGSEDKEELQVISKTQMYEAANLGINRFSIYKGILNETAYRKILIENDLPYALRKGQLHIVYQPQLDLNKGKISGVELLIRWKHPIMGEVSPVEFLPFAEQYGLLKDIFLLVFEEACKNIVNRVSREIQYAINLSVNQLLDENFVHDVSKTLKKYNISASQITLEIVEDIEIYSIKRVQQKLNLLKQLDFTISLDDFGKGYFSFSDFINLPIDFIKLDKDFVSSLMENKKNKRIILPIIMMAHNLGLKVIIEGIEDEVQFNDWRNFGCDVAQGYFISKPLSLSKFFKSIEMIEGRFG
ncbi:putative bifunctional diguanylate cyclase/phosphodiesterase [Priestia megaterium]|uniref:putative bifunctional diguanylate cyclase/phosphodiesterase n=1 Tax=Priestia megaterium TaxID=1404 RepID=UPI003F81D111